MSGRYNQRTALLVVDLQNDFADPSGNLYVRRGEQVVPATNREIARAGEAGALVALTQDWHPESTPHFAKDGGVWPVHCVAGTWGAALHPELDVPAGAPVVRKGTGGEDGYSGFTVRQPGTDEAKSTELEALLRQAGVERVVIVGLATDYCVKDTALDAVAKGFVTEVLADAVRAVDLQPGDGDRAFDVMRAAGAAII